jgi:hypothetical protein
VADRRVRQTGDGEKQMRSRASEAARTGFLCPGAEAQAGVPVSGDRRPVGPGRVP